MKKILGLLFILTFVILSSACSNNLESVSKNLSLYSLNIEYIDESHTLNVEQNISLKNPTETSLNELYFHLYPSAFSEGVVNKPVGVLSKVKAYPNGESYGNIKIDSIKSNSEELNFNIEGTDKDFLKVELSSPLDLNSNINLSLTYTVTLPNINHRFGYGNNTINCANFYPILCVYEEDWVKEPYHYNGDPFYSYLANYEVNLTAPSNLVLATSGEIKEVKENENKKSYSIDAYAVRDYAFVLSEKFNVLEEQVGKTNVKYYYYDEENPEEFLTASVDSLNTFNELFGEYPYSTLSVVKSNFVHGGMEYPNLVLISDDTSEKADYINVIVHEIAHQWWYGLVGNDEFRYGWLDEGLTEYSTNLFYQKNPQYNVDASEVIKNTTSSWVTFVDLYTSVLGNVDTSMNRKLDEYNTEPEYVYVTYVKGMLFFNELKTLLGDAKFLKAVQTYFEMYKFKNVTPEHLLGIFEQVSHTDLKGFFDSWINGNVVIK